MNLPVSNADVRFAQSAESIFGQLPQLDIRVETSLHNGVYARTAFLPAGIFLTGCLTKVPTTLLVFGNCALTAADGVHNVRGFAQFETAAGRKTVFRTETDTQLVMIFKTDAKTLEEARRQMTDDILLGEQK